jgi:hypothetical protein
MSREERRAYLIRGFERARLAIVLSTTKKENLISNSELSNVFGSRKTPEQRDPYQG